jgi:DNA-binding CsgD family transcriptional regulator
VPNSPQKGNPEHFVHRATACPTENSSFRPSQCILISNFLEIIQLWLIFAFQLFIKINTLMIARTQELTARELEVLKLLSCGLNSKEISERLYISTNTVEYHRKQLLRKMEARNAAELIGKAYRMNILKVEE